MPPAIQCAIEILADGRELGELPDLDYDYDRIESLLSDIVDMGLLEPFVDGERWAEDQVSWHLGHEYSVLHLFIGQCRNGELTEYVFK